MTPLSEQSNDSKEKNIAWVELDRSKTPHLFIGSKAASLHEPKLCPECIEPGRLKELTDMVATEFETPPQPSEPPTPTDTNTSFKKELEQILDQYYAPIKLPDNNRTALITSIINLVDKGLPKKHAPDPRGSQHYCYNDAIDDMRAIIRGNDDREAL